MSLSLSPPVRVAMDEVDIDDYDQYLELKHSREAQDQARIAAEDGMCSDSDSFTGL
jgi:hypothetical protein